MKDDDRYTDEEAERRMNEAMRRALNTPPKPQPTARLSPKGKKLARIGDVRSAMAMRALRTGFPPVHDQFVDR